MSNDYSKHLLNPNFVETKILLDECQLDINLEDLIYNNLSKENFKILASIGKSGTPQDFVSYRHNKLGYRSIEFNESSEYLAAGCSQTFGLGVHEEFMWSNILSKKINKPIPNLSIVGGSISSIINNIFAYCKKFGNPKNIFLLLPDPYRMQIPTQRKYITSSQISNEDKETENLPYLTYLYFMNNNRKNVEKYKKMPYNLEEILPLDIPFFYSMQSINTLIQYCNSSNINLVWSSHDLAFDLAMSTIKYSNYVSSEESLWNHEGHYGEDPFGYKKWVTTKSTYNSKLCHEDMRHLDEKIFDCGNDGSHYGIHQHYHMAEIFERFANV